MERMVRRVEVEQSEHDQSEKKRGWFDVVMGSNDDSSSDEGSTKRRYNKIPPIARHQGHEQVSSVWATMLF